MEDTCMYDFLTIEEILEIEPDLQIEQHDVTNNEKIEEIEEEIF